MEENVVQLNAASIFRIASLFSGRGIGSRRLLSGLPGRALFTGASMLAFASVLSVVSLWRPIISVIDNIASVILVLTASYWCFAAVRAYPADGTSRPVALAFVGVGLLSFACGKSISTSLQFTYGWQAPFPSWADVAFLASYPLLLIGIMLMPARPLPLSERGRVVCDTLIILTGLVTLSWYFLLGPILGKSAESQIARVFSAAYPLCDLMLLGCLCVINAQTRASLPVRTVVLFGVGLVAIVMADSVHAYLCLVGRYVTGDQVDLLWPLGYLLIGLGAASTRRVKRSAVDDSTPAVPLLWQSMLPYVLLPPVVSLFVCTYDRMGDVSLARGVYYGASLLILLVIVRQAVAIAHLIDDLKERVVDLEAARKSLTLLAERDGLTGLYNHRTVYEKLDAILKEANGKPTSVIVMDMDDFKSINDVYGHPVGDDVLRHVTGILRRTSPDEAFLGRCGGDEFMIILPGHDGESAGEVALGLRKAIDVSPYQVHNGPQIPMHLCFGISDTIICGTSIASLISSADSALYEGKLHGGDQVTLHTVPSSDDSVADIGESSFDVLEGLVTTIDNKDHYTRRHSDDVCRYSLLLVEALGMSDDTQRAMRVAGLLHDVGKIGIPDAILRKPGRLTDQEYDVMKGHVTLSTLIIHGLPRLADILDGVSHHHERWDGTGYPNGLAGKEIPLLGRVMAIADAFSAMTLDRPYRVALKVGTALDEIEKGAGTQFDPELAKLFVESVRRRPTLTMTNDQARLRKAA